MVDRKEITSNDAEVAVISILFNNPDLAYSLDGLRSFMFSSAPHQYIFQEVEEQIETQTPIDMGLFIAKLESSNAISKAGGKKYLEHLVKQQFNPDTLPHYKAIVIDSYKSRTLISMGSGLRAESVNIDNVDEVIHSMKYGLDSLLEARGGSLTVKLGDKTKDIYEEIVARQGNPGIKGASWGIRELDRATGGKCPGEVIIIGGRPGQGKTAVICNSILTDARNGVASLLFQREMRLQELAERFISIITGIPINNIRLGIINETQVKQIHEAMKELKTLPIYIDTSYRSSDLYYIESTIQRYKRLYDIKVVYLDYLQILIERDDNQTHELGRITRLFKTLSNELDICSVLLSQLNRGVEQRENKRPVLSDLRQSGNLEEDADIVVGLYRDSYYNKETKYKGLMEFIILKYRNGPVGTVTLKFHDETNVIEGT